MIALLLSLVVMVVVYPEFVGAANLQILSDFAGIGSDIGNIGYGLGGGAVVWSGYQTAQAYRHRDDDGLKPVFKAGAATVIGGIMLVTVVPKYVGPIMAAGSTLW